MIVRSNYLLIQEHLKYLGEVMQAAPASVERYRFHLHHLLIWADARPWLATPEIRPTFPVYLKSLNEAKGQRPLAAVTHGKLLKVSRRFFHWLPGRTRADSGSCPRPGSTPCAWRRERRPASGSTNTSARRK